MAITLVQIDSIKSPQVTFDIPNGKVRITDTGNWAVVPLATGASDHVKVMAKITGPSGVVVYENANYAAGDFATPGNEDFDSLKADPDNKLEINFELATGGLKLEGNYVVELKYEVYEDGTTTTITTTASLTAKYCGDPCEDITGVIDAVVNAQASTLATTDNTAYGTYISLVRNHELWPPSQDEAGLGGDVQTYNFGPTITTGNYDVKVTSTISYLQSDSSIVICEKVIIEDFTVDVDDNLCKVYCVLNKYRTQYYQTLALGQDTTSIFKNLTLASAEYILAVQGRLCAQPYQQHIDKIYELTGISKDCDECSASTAPTPIIPTGTLKGDPGVDGIGITSMSIVGSTLSITLTNGNIVPITVPSATGGLDGADGSSFIGDAGAPDDGADGVNGDWYLNTTTGDIYGPKTGGAWGAIVFSTKGPTGDDGADGAVIIEAGINVKTVTGVGSYDDTNKINLLVEESSAPLPTDGSTLSLEAIFTSLGKADAADPLDSVQIRLVQPGTVGSPFSLTRQHPFVLAWDAIVHAWAPGYYYIRVDIIRTSLTTQAIRLVESNVEYSNFKSDILIDTSIDLAQDFSVEIRGRNGASTGNIALHNFIIKKFVN